MKTQSRMDKYYDISENNIDNNETPVLSSRTKKNQQLYKEVSNLELNDFDLNSNISILGDNPENINISELEEQLSLKYKQEPKNRGLGNTDEIPLPKINLDETREYDINSIIEKAKENKEVDYEEERLKKIRNTQYDILRGLDIFKKVEKEEEPEEEPENRVVTDGKELRELIDTITAKELIKEEKKMNLEEEQGELDPLDLLSDLRGDDDNTKVLGALVEEEEEEEVREESEEKKEAEEKIEKMSLPEIKEEPPKKEEEKEKELTLTKTAVLSQSEFDDFKDIKEEMNTSKIIVTVLVIILVLLLIAGAVVIANYYLKLGLF